VSEIFEEYWGQNTTGQYGRIERVIAKNAWVTCEKSQQKKIDELEKKLAEAVGLIKLSQTRLSTTPCENGLTLGENYTDFLKSLKEKEAQGE
jgi:hypothetical protein